MRLRILSDIHLELSNVNISRFIPPAPLLDTTLILAGDIGNPSSKVYKHFITEMSKCHDNVIIVTGNHEYYQPKRKVFNHREGFLVSRDKYTMSDVDANLWDFTLQLPNVDFLQCRSVIYDRVRFLGCTLWSTPDKKLSGRMNDYHLIPDMTVEKCQALHNSHVDWLQEQLAINSTDYDTTIVVTHHLPSFSLVAPTYSNNPLNVFYASHQDDLIRKADIWVCGHSHTAINKRLGRCRCYINPIGYVYEQTGCDINLSIPILES